MASKSTKRKAPEEKKQQKKAFNSKKEDAVDSEGDEVPEDEGDADNSDGEDDLTFIEQLNLNTDDSHVPAPGPDDPPYEPESQETDAKTSSASRAKSKSNKSQDKSKDGPSSQDSHVVYAKLLTMNDTVIDAECRQAYLDCFLLAQLSGAIKVGKPQDKWGKDDCETYFHKYRMVLNHTGWNMPKPNIQKLKLDDKFQISKTVLKQMSAILAKQQIAAIQNTLDEMKSAQSKHASSLFSWSNTHAKTMTFDMGIADHYKDKNGKDCLDIHMSFGYVTAVLKERSFLWIDFDSSKVDMYYWQTTISFDKDKYEQVKDKVQEKLADKQKKYIAKVV